MAEWSDDELERHVAEGPVCTAGIFDLELDIAGKRFAFGNNVA